MRIQISGYSWQCNIVNIFCFLLHLGISIFLRLQKRIAKRNVFNLQSVLQFAYSISHITYRPTLDWYLCMLSMRILVRQMKITTQDLSVFISYLPILKNFLPSMAYLNDIHYFPLDKNIKKHSKQSRKYATSAAEKF